MARDRPFEPDDFPVESNENSIVTNKDELVAMAPSREKAEEITRRLNEHAAQDELDRWSA
jgi:hypothetical protein